MKKRIHLSQSLYLDLEVTAAQLLVIIALFMATFVIPVYAFNRLSEPAAATQATSSDPAVISETYTEEALNGGSVAGASTVRGANYVNIPLLDIPFDTTLADPNSIPILVGGVLGGISIVLFLYLFIDTILR